MSEENLNKNLSSMKKSLKQLETDVKNAKKEKNPLPNDRFSEVMNDFSNQAKVRTFTCLCFSVVVSVLFLKGNTCNL